MLASIIFAPWWVAGVLILAAIFIFPDYYESLVLATLFDILYASGSFFVAHSSLLAVLLVLLISLFLRERVILYARSL